MNRCSLYLIGALLLSGPGHAATFTLDEAVRRTAEQNYSVLASAQTIDTAEAEVRVAESARMPQVVLRYAAQISDNPLDAFAEKLNTRSVRVQDFEPDRLNDPDISTLFNGGVAVQYSVYNGGRTEAEIQRAGHNTDAARLRHRRVLQRLVFNTVRAYFGTQAAERGRSIANDAEQAALQHARTTRRLVREDRTVKSDQLTAEVNLTAFRSLTAQADTQLKLAYSRLKVAANLPQDQVVAVDPLSVKPITAKLAGIRTYERRALERRFDLQALQAALAAARAGLLSAQSDLRPRIDLVADTSLYEDDPFVNEHSWRVMGVVSKDLYTGGRTRSTVDAAQSRIEGLRYQVESLKQAIIGDVNNAYDRVNDSMARLTIAKGNVRKARRNVALIQERYGQGRTILIDLLGAEQRLVAARDEELVAMQSLLTNLARLALADGSLDPDNPASYRGQTP